MRVSDLTKGLTIEYEGDIYEVIEYEHSKRARGDAFARTKLKDLETGRIVSKTFKGQDKVKKAYLEEKPLSFLYSDRESYYFMDKKTYEQFELTKDHLDEDKYYLKENLDLKGKFYQGAIVNITLPTFVCLTVEKTSPGVRGNTASGGDKPAVLETSKKVKVPLFVKEGDKIKVDTRTGEYVERVET